MCTCCHRQHHHHSHSLCKQNGQSCIWDWLQSPIPVVNKIYQLFHIAKDHWCHHDQTFKVKDLYQGPLTMRRIQAKSSIHINGVGYDHPWYSFWGFYILDNVTTYEINVLILKSFQKPFDVTFCISFHRRYSFLPTPSSKLKTLPGSWIAQIASNRVGIDVLGTHHILAAAKAT